MIKALRIGYSEAGRNVFLFEHTLTVDEPHTLTKSSEIDMGLTAVSTAPFRGIR